MNIGYLIDFMNNARSLDLKEAELMQDTPFTEMLLKEVEDADVLVNERNEVVAIGGVNYGYDKPVVWMLCTHRVEQNPIEFLKWTKGYLKSLMPHVSHLWNVAWLGNPLHIKWLTWMGARWYEDITIRTGETFRRFEFVQEDFV